MPFVAATGCSAVASAPRLAPTPASEPVAAVTVLRRWTPRNEFLTVVEQTGRLHFGRFLGACYVRRSCNIAYFLEVNRPLPDGTPAMEVDGWLADPVRQWLAGLAERDPAHYQRLLHAEPWYNPGVCRALA